MRQNHPLLIYADIDHYHKIDRTTKTISYTTAIERLKLISKEKLELIDKGRLQKAQLIRNQMIHYDTEIIPQKAKKDFSNLFDFVNSYYKIFFEDYCCKPLEKYIYKENMREKKIIEEYFGTEFVYWKGYTIYREFMKEQKYKYLMIDRKRYERIKFGDEPKILGIDEYPGYYDIACHDCDAVVGLYHTLGCDVEICPRCHKQLISCGCIPVLEKYRTSTKFFKNKKCLTSA